MTNDGEMDFTVWLADINPSQIMEEDYRPQTQINFSRGETAAESAALERAAEEAARAEEPPEAAGDANYFVYTTGDDLARAPGSSSCEVPLRGPTAASWSSPIAEPTLAS